MMHHINTGFSNTPIILAMGLVLASVLAYSLKDEGFYGRIDFLKTPLVLTLFKKRPFQFVLQVPFVLLFSLTIAAGLFGSQVPGSNLATVVVWTVWWTGIVVATVLLGKFWCAVCPWAAVGDWVQRMSFWKKKGSTLSLDLKWPVRFRNLYPAIFAFLALTWAEFQFHLVSSPRGTAKLAIVIVFVTVLAALIYERRSLCRYLCPIGSMLGLYSMSSSLELRARDRLVCRRCPTKDCVNGNELGYGCPVLEYPESMEVNTYCILCTECIKTCPEDNVALGFRTFGSELTRPIRKRLDEGLFAIVVLGVVIFHSFTMIDYWFTWLDLMKAKTGLSPEGIAALSLAGTVLVTGGVYFIFSLLTKVTLREKGVLLIEVFTSFSYVLIPLALFYHLAHNIMHLFMEVPGVSSVILDPFGWGGAGAAQKSSPGMYLSHGQVEFIQALLVVAGVWLGMRVAANVSKGFSAHPTAAFIVQALMIGVVTFFYGWILNQPMIMRMG